MKQKKNPLIIYLFSNCKITYFQRNSKCVYSSKGILLSVKRKKKTTKVFNTLLNLYIFALETVNLNKT